MQLSQLATPIFASSPTPLPFAEEIFGATVEAVTAEQTDSPWDAVVGVEMFRGFGSLGVPKLGFSMLFGRNKDAAEKATRQLQISVLAAVIGADEKRGRHVRTYQYTVRETKDRVVADTKGEMYDDKVKAGLGTAKLMLEAGIRLSSVALYGRDVPSIQSSEPIVVVAGGGLRLFDEDEPHLMQFARSIPGDRSFQEGNIPKEPDTVYTFTPKGAFNSLSVYFLDRNAPGLGVWDTRVIDAQFHHSDPAEYSQAFVVGMTEFLVTAQLRSRPI